MEKLDIASHLTDSQYSLFLNVYAAHNRGMGTEKRKDYSLSHITKVKWDKENQALNVYYRNGDWWHYAKDGTWF